METSRGPRVSSRRHVLLKSSHRYSEHPQRGQRATKARRQGRGPDGVQGGGERGPGDSETEPTLVSAAPSHALGTRGGQLCRPLGTARGQGGGWCGPEAGGDPDLTAANPNPAVQVGCPWPASHKAQGSPAGKEGPAEPRRLPTQDTLAGAPLMAVSAPSMASLISCSGSI